MKCFDRKTRLSWINIHSHMCDAYLKLNLGPSHSLYVVSSLARTYICVREKKLYFHSGHGNLCLVYSVCFVCRVLCLTAYCVQCVLWFQWVQKIGCKSKITIRWKLLKDYNLLITFAPKLSISIAKCNWKKYIHINMWTLD